MVRSFFPLSTFDQEKNPHTPHPRHQNLHPLLPPAFRPPHHRRRRKNVPEPQPAPAVGLSRIPARLGAVGRRVPVRRADDGRGYHDDCAVGYVMHLFYIYMVFPHILPIPISSNATNS